MHECLHFNKAKMPPSRVADFQLSCLDGSVFVDFNLGKDQRIYLKRISFDGYGCCELKTPIKPLNLMDSKSFIEAFDHHPMRNSVLEVLLKKSIAVNINQIWVDAVEEYGLRVPG